MAVVVLARLRGERPRDPSLTPERVRGAYLIEDVAAGRDRHGRAGRRKRLQEQLVLAKRVDRDQVAVHELRSEVPRPGARLDVTGTVHEQLAVAAVRELPDQRHAGRPGTEAQL